MPYRFNFDLSKVSRYFFSEITKVSYQRGIHRKVGRTAREIIEKFRVQQATGLDLSDAVLLLEDLMDIQARNFLERERFGRTRRRALFLPHCSRKYMDNRCKAAFNPDIPSYICARCSPDCLINKATTFAERRGYDVYILPGGSCVPKILKERRYEGVVGVACGEEIKLSGKIMENMGIAAQAVPLIKNGCANTVFNLETLLKFL